jgi:membrane-associated phospholipid phosphatase
LIRSKIFFVVSLCLMTGVLNFARAESDSLRSQRWAPMQGHDYWTLGAFSAAAIGVSTLPNRGTGGWGSGILLDDSARSALRSSSDGGRADAASLSDKTVALAALSPFLIDAIGFQWLGAGDHAGALSTAVLSAQAIALNVFLSELTKREIRRKRPIQVACENGSAQDSLCGSTDAYRSFFSGHTSLAFTGAGLVCLNHKKLNITGGSRSTDAWVCGGALALATTTGILRITADRHYASDVLVGAVVGLFSGYIMPILLHEPESTQASGPQVTWSIAPQRRDAVALQTSIQF